MSSIRFLAAPGALLLLSACASLPADWGRGALDAQLRDRGLSSATVPRERFTAQALREPLDLERAIQLALLNNPELQARYASLGFAAAEVYEAGRLSNPLLSFTQLSAGGEAHAQLTLGVAVNFTELLFARTHRRIADAQFAAQKAAVGSAALELAAQVEAAYRRCAAAAQLLQLRERLAQTAQVSAALAQRYYEAGNLKPAELALEQAGGAQAALQADTAQLELSLARASLQRLMGLADTQTPWQLAEPLAALPAADEALDRLQAQAQASRLDLQAAQAQLQAVQARYGIATPQSLIGELQLGAERERDYDGSLHAGPTAAISLPLFDTGKGRRARAQAELQEAQAALQAAELDVQTQLHSAYAQLRSSRKRAERYRDELIPARERAFEALQREHNYMLIGSFELLAARQQSFDAYAGYIEALRDYQLARADLARAVGRRLPQTDPAPAAALPEAAPQDPHAHHHGDHTP
ncbi:outer membrane protein, cobalt-zinc-cadmium efflux system [Solimonas aquatica]|uniref:Outer membrane protein, cobalt-zinc-cadmium efflux system n=1 Tax=Solimonas aquatica TaxID=489703 RepID=A0A1H9LSA5_9GAMM|nr:TolC family protein [Solimonas aquatica]SER14392.1 outer membrane protein, cobalt-zinc-cadmium efflux system [Solimonas aquatica]